MNSATPLEQLAEIKRGTVEIITEADLLLKIERSYQEKIPLRIKAGFDPSRPDLHLGHTVLLSKLKVFQVLGHQVIYLIGDFTAQIGDPSGKNETRPTLSEQEVKENARSYAEQVFKILDREKTELAFNSTWMSVMRAADLVKLASQHTVARMLERDDFNNRFKNNQPISIHEFLYPLVQGYDSVALRADIELGGTDQKFNLLVGREIQRSYGLPPQSIITLPILEGTDGQIKMSKSLNNCIALQDSPTEMFGKVMSISDELMFRYYELLSEIPAQELLKLRQGVSSGMLHPRDIKAQLAHFLTQQYHGEDAACRAQEEFERVFSHHQLPTDLAAISLPAQSNLWIGYLLKNLELVASTSEAQRLLKAMAVEMDGVKISDPNVKVTLVSGAQHILRVGKKKFSKIKVE